MGLFDRLFGAPTPQGRRVRLDASALASFPQSETRLRVSTDGGCAPNLRGDLMFLSAPKPSEASSAHYARDITDDGYVSNLTRLWAWRPDVFDAFLNARALLTEKAGLSLRERAILVCASAANLGDSYCSLAWGTNKLSITTSSACSS